MGSRQVSTDDKATCTHFGEEATFRLPVHCFGRARAPLVAMGVVAREAAIVEDMDRQAMYALH